MEFLSYLVSAGAAYLLGSTPTGYLVARAKGVDIRTVGSGNIGATNVFRILGRAAGVAVLTIDFLKGWLACAVVAGVAFEQISSPAAAGADLREYHSITAGIFAVLGHNYTCWLRFQGGKGIATSAGVLVALVPGALLVGLGVWVVVFALGRYVSLASIAASFALPIAVWLTGGSTVMIAITAGLAVLAIYKHRSNVRRLLNGTEHRVAWPRKDSTP